MKCGCGAEMVRVLAGSWVCVRCRAYCTVGSEESWNHAIAPATFVDHAAIAGALEVLREIERRSAEVMVTQTECCPICGTAPPCPTDCR